jgi:hypothetical protein
MVADNRRGRTTRMVLVFRPDAHVAIVSTCAVRWRRPGRRGRPRERARPRCTELFEESGDDGQGRVIPQVEEQGGSEKFVTVTATRRLMARDYWDPRPEEVSPRA